MWKKIVLSMAMVLVSGSTGAALAQDQRDANVEFEGIYWFSDQAANARISSQTQRGTDFNLESDVDLGEQNIPSGRFTWFTGPKSRIFLDYSQISYSGDAVLNKQITFRDTTFNVGASVSSDLKLRFAKLGWIWQFITSGDGACKLGTLLEVSGMTADLSLTGAAAGIGATTAEKSAAVGLPTVGLALDINPSNSVNLFLRASGMSSGRYGYFGGGEVGIKLIPVKNLSISGGYRYETIEAKGSENDTRLQFQFKGPFAGASLRF